MSQQFRAEFAASVRASPRVAYEPYEPADPVRLPPRLLAIVALLIAVLLASGYAIWRSGLLSGEGADERARLAAAGEPVGAPDNSAAPATQHTQAAVATSGPVRITAVQPTWFEVTDRAGGARLYTGVLAQGQSFDVPPSAGDPVIRTGKPEGLQVTVSGHPVAPLGEPAHTVSNVSLKAAALVARGAPPTTVPQSSVTAPAPERATAAASPVTPDASLGGNATVPPAFRAATEASNTATPQQ